MSAGPRTNIAKASDGDVRERYVSHLEEHANERTLLVCVNCIGRCSKKSVEDSTVKTKPLRKFVPFFLVKMERVWFLFSLFFSTDLRSAILFARSRRELSIDVAEHRPILKNYTLIRTTSVLFSYPRKELLTQDVSYIPWNRPANRFVSNSQFQ